MYSLLFHEGDVDETVNDFIPFVGPVKVEQDAKRGRRLVATRSIEPGECLFVIEPTVSAPVDKVYELWCTKAARGCRRTLEEVSEDMLVEEMKHLLLNGNMKSERAIYSFALQVGLPETDDMIYNLSLNATGNDFINTLVGKETVKPCQVYLPVDKIKEEKHLLSIIRRNAFGPDFHNYSNMEGTWNDTMDGPRPYRRVLGLYPLAAMINHGCTSNAVKVFAGETMIVHASTMISQGSEITWSYLPSGVTLAQRSKLIETKFGFKCNCDRCKDEKFAYDIDESLTRNLESNTLLSKLNDSKLSASSSTSALYSISELDVLKVKIENVLSNDKLSHQVRRYLRVGYLPFYITYFNAALQETENPTLYEQVVAVATQVHFALVSCNNGSTEHLSILHLIYDLVVTMHSTSTDQDKTIIKVRFWTEQLKRAHMIRYGELGKSLEYVRDVMKHTKIVLRQPKGFRMVKTKFI